MWKGTMATLKPKPTSIRPVPRLISMTSGWAAPRAARMSAKPVPPAKPYTKAMPMSRKAELNPPRIRYLKPPSLLRMFPRTPPTRM